jgi:hypothetical protein
MRGLRRKLQNTSNSQHIILISAHILSKDQSPRSSARRTLHGDERSEEAEAHLNHADKEEATVATGDDQSRSICMHIS